MLVSTENTFFSFVSELVRGKETQREKSVRLLRHFVYLTKEEHFLSFHQAQPVALASCAQVAGHLFHYIIIITSVVI